MKTDQEVWDELNVHQQQNIKDLSVLFPHIGFCKKLEWLGNLRAVPVLNEASASQLVRIVINPPGDIDAEH